MGDTILVIGTTCYERQELRECNRNSVLTRIFYKGGRFKNYQVADLLVQLLDSRTRRKEFNYKIASLSDYSKDKTNRITVQGHGK